MEHLAKERKGPLDGIIGRLERLFEEIKKDAAEAEHARLRARLEVEYLRGEIRRQLPWKEYEALLENFHKDVLANVPKSLGGYKE